MALRIARSSRTVPPADRGGATVLAFPARERRDEVVAEVLADGTIRVVEGAMVGSTSSTTDPSGFREGSLAGQGWTLWWERRLWP